MRNHWRVPALDGLRAVAVLVVVCCHLPSQYRLAGGNTGVDLFFVLSGFLITSILLNEWRDSGRISIPHFYLRRAFRLFPAAFSVLLFATLAAPWVQPSAELKEAGGDALAVLFYVFNWRLVDLFETGRGVFHNHMLSHYWSLSVEEQFYLIWPALLLLLLRLRAPKAAMLAFFSAGIIVPAVARAVLWKHGASLELYFRSDLRVDGLLWGSALAWLAHHKMLPDGQEVRRYGGLVGFTALLVFLYFSQFDALTNGASYRYGFSMIGLVSTLMIASAIIAPDSFFSACLSLKWLRYIGKISYGVYLWHIPVIILSGHVATSNVTMRPWIASALTLGIAALSFRYFETPFLRLKERFGYADPASAAQIAPKSV